MKLLLKSALCIALASTSGCLRPETGTPVQQQCDCSGMRCLNNIIGKLTPSADEEADPCLGCHVAEMGRCAESCGTDDWSIPGCPLAYACQAWKRVAAGSACTTTADCEPGELAGSAPNALVCEASKCVYKGAAKWLPAPQVKECSGSPTFGAHPQCGANACLGEDDFSAVRHCTAARCLTNDDCPSQWHCRCQEEITSGGLKAYRWCVPNQAAPDAGTGDAGI